MVIGTGAGTHQFKIRDDFSVGGLEVATSVGALNGLAGTVLPGKLTQKWSDTVLNTPMAWSGTSGAQKAEEFILKRGTDFIAGATNYIATTTDQDAFNQAPAKGLEEVKKGMLSGLSDLKPEQR